MRPLWEPNNTTQLNCQRADNDAPFFIPMKRKDLVHLRLGIPYQYVILNGAGLPTATAITLSVVDELGTTTYLSYGAGGPTPAKFLTAYRNDSTNKLAEYQFLFPFRVPDENGDKAVVYKFSVTSGDVVVLDDNGTVYEFIYGVQQTPEYFDLIDTDTLAFCVYSSAAAGVTLEINGVSTAFTSIVGSLTGGGTHEEYKCFRFKVSVNFATWGQTKDFYSVPYKIIHCEDDMTVKLRGEYPTSTVDCANHLHTGSLYDATRPFFLNILRLRVPAGLQSEPSTVRVTYNANQRAIKSEYSPGYRLMSEPMPLFMEQAVESIALAKKMSIDNLELISENGEQIFQNTENNGSVYKYLSLSLRQSKCEKVFVC